MKHDPWIASLIWGRVGAAIWMIAAVVFKLSTEETETGNQAITTILGGVGVLLALFSKVREGMKDRKSRDILRVIAFLMLLPMFFIGGQGCATFDKQITDRDVASWANAIYNAQYDDYLTWFNKQTDGSYVIKPNVSEEQKEILVTKKKIFIELQPLLLIFSEYVQTGVKPTAVLITNVEARIIQLVNDLIEGGD